MSWAWRRGEASSQWHQGLVQKVVSLNTIAIRSREIALVIGALMHVRPNVFTCLWRYLCGEPSQLSVWNVISKSITRGMLLAPNWFLQVRIPGETLQWNHPNDCSVSYKLFCQYTAAAILPPTSYTFFQLHSWSPANFLDIIDTLLPVGDQTTVQKRIQFTTSSLFWISLPLPLFVAIIGKCTVVKPFGLDGGFTMIHIE